MKKAAGQKDSIGTGCLMVRTDRPKTVAEVKSQRDDATQTEGLASIVYY
jgi:hypothetical protein